MSTQAVQVAMPRDSVALIAKNLLLWPYKTNPATAMTSRQTTTSAKPATATAKTTTAKPASVGKRKTPVSRKAAEYGSYIRKAREQKRMPEQELADELGVSQNKINKIENGQVKLTVEDVEGIAGVLGMTVSELLPSLVGRYNGDQNNHDNVMNPVVNHQNFDAERQVWQSLEKTQREVIEAKDAIIASKNDIIEALQLVVKLKVE